MAMFSQQESDLRYLEDMIRDGSASYLTPKTSDPNWEELIFVEHIPRDMLVVRDRAMANGAHTLQWHLVVAKHKGMETSYELDGLGVGQVVYADLAVARERLERAARSMR